MPLHLDTENRSRKGAAKGSFDEAAVRRSRVQIIFSHRDPSFVERCVHELSRVGFAVDSHLVPEASAVTRHPQWQSFDTVVCEYPADPAEQKKVLSLLGETRRDLPVILLADKLSKEAAAALLLHGVSECVDSESMSHLPVALRRALNERSLRRERDRAEKELRKLEGQYRALAGNLSYGICRCAADGTFLDVNQALVKMMRYSSREELLGVNIAAPIFADTDKLARLLGQSTDGLADPVEAEWPRQDGSSLKVRLSAQEILSEQGRGSFEVIVEDITKQRELEDHLRRLAASDPLTGLANYRHLIDSMDREIRRSNRTGREFALLLFDMDGLKQLNDSFGHLTGSQALCRMADALTLFCRDIDIAARFGGDEFALLLPETGLEAAHLVARRIGGSISEDSNGPRISVSVGVSVYPLHGQSVEAIVSAADTAMYAMKRERKQAATVAG